MRFSFDLDGTVSAHPEIFRALGSALRADGHSVYILTGNDERSFRERRMREVPALRDESWYERALTAPLHESDAAGHHERVLAFKRRALNEHQIDLHFDDDADLFRDSGGVPVFHVRRPRP